MPLAPAPGKLCAARRGLPSAEGLRECRSPHARRGALGRLPAHTKDEPPAMNSVLLAGHTDAPKAGHSQGRTQQIDARRQAENVDLDALVCGDEQPQ